MSQILQNYSLQKHNSFGFEVRSSRYCECNSINDIREILVHREFRNSRHLVLGEGSNILFKGDYGGFILRPLIRGREIVQEDKEYVWIKAGAGENWDDFVAWTTAWGYGGIENLSLIPGSVGSSPIQNIGAYGVEVKEAIEQVEAIDIETGQKLVFMNESCQFGYRDSIFKHGWKDKCIITTVLFKLLKNPELNLSYQMLEKKMSEKPKRDVETLRQVVIEIRRSKLPDPDEFGNAGSFFKNPLIAPDVFRKLYEKFPGLPSYPAPGGWKKIPAAWLIEQTGWKGKRMGNAGSYEKQPLVLVNYGHSNGEEMLELASGIERDVYNMFSVELEKEVNII